MTDLRDRVESALRTHAAPALELDGAGIEVVAVADGIASVRLTGACASCPGGVHGLVTGLEQQLRLHVPEVEFIEIVL
ncbi:MAG: NifU family protein [Fimbriiglobus sp.]